MAYRSSRGRSGGRRFSARSRAERARGRRSGGRRGGGGRSQTVRLVIQQGPPAAGLALPGVAGVAVGREGLNALTAPTPGRARF